jgi:prolipoprotein diacylglyceryltransferase
MQDTLLAVILGAFAKLRTVIIGFVMSVRLSVRLFAWNNSAPTGRIFMNFNISYFSKICREIQVSLQSENNNGYYTRRPICIYDFMFEFPYIVSLYYIRNQQESTLTVSFISHCKITLHVSDAFCVHHQEY